LTALTAVSMFASLLLVPSAGAQIVVGQVANSGNAIQCEYASPADELVTQAATGTSYAIPAPGGVITSWSTTSFLPTANQRFGLKVFRASGPNTFTALAQDNRVLTPNSVNTFSVSIPVQAGDLVGFHLPSEAETDPVDCAFESSLQNNWAYLEGSAPLGVPTAFTEAYESLDLANISVTVLPPPAITSLSPAEGSVKGGSSVVIAGANFATVSGVSFGSTPATSFTVNSEGQITAVAPASTTLSQVPVTVTTSAGTATSAQLFAYRGCKVPQLKKTKLKAAKKKLAKANCKIGKVKKLHGATSKTGKVKKQNPKSGKILAPGSKVKVTLDV